MAFKSEYQEPELKGPVELIAALPKVWRRIVLILMFIYAGFIILIATQPFTESLISFGKTFGISEFLLLQWVAPLASESPEMIVLFYFAFRGSSSSAMTAIVSSTINQWTLLIASLPLAFSLSRGSWSFLPLDPRPREEVLLTAAQALFAISIITNLKISLWEAMLLLILFVSQLFIPSMHIRYIYSAIYILLGLIWLIKQRKEFQHDFMSIIKKLQLKLN